MAEYTEKKEKKPLFPNSKLWCFLLGRLFVGVFCLLLTAFFIAFFENEEEWLTFSLLGITAAVSGGFFLWKGKGHRRQVDAIASARGIFLLWAALSLWGTLPFFCAGHLSFADSFFESVSFLTTTGISLLPEGAPKSLFLWQTLLGFMGGLFFLVILVTLMPQASGFFGISLAFRKGLMFSPMLYPMEHLAKQIGKTYMIITLFSAFLFFLAGLSPIDAVQMAMLTVSTTGGDPTHSLELANHYPKMAATITLMLTVGNILRYFRTWQRRDFRDYYQNPETKFFFFLLASGGIIVTFCLFLSTSYTWSESVFFGFFKILSYASTTGTGAVDVGLFPDLCIFVFVISAFMGGCMGSVTGGMKLIRVLVLFKLLAIEIRRTLHPSMMGAPVLGNAPVPKETAGRILTFFFLYIAGFFVFVVLTSFSATDLSEAVGMTIACYTTLGNTLGLAAPEAFVLLPWPVKIILGIFMLIVRMEIFAFLVFVASYFDDRRKNW